MWRMVLSQGINPCRNVDYATLRITCWEISRMKTTHWKEENASSCSMSQSCSFPFELINTTPRPTIPGIHDKNDRLRSRIIRRINQCHNRLHTIQAASISSEEGRTHGAYPTITSENLKQKTCLLYKTQKNYIAMK